MAETKVWNCKGCSHYDPRKGCAKTGGCDFIPAMARLEKILSQ